MSFGSILLILTAAIGLLSGIVLKDIRTKLITAGGILLVLFIYAMMNNFSSKDAFCIFLFVYFVPFSIGSWIAKGKNLVKRKK